MSDGVQGTRGGSGIDFAALGRRTPAESAAAEAQARAEMDSRSVEEARERSKTRVSGRLSGVPDLRVLPNGETVVRFDLFAGRAEPAPFFVTFPTSGSDRLARDFLDKVDALARPDRDGAPVPLDLTVAGRWRKGAVLASGKPNFWFEGAEVAVGRDVRLPLLDGVASPTPVVATGASVAPAGHMLDDGSVRLGGGRVLAIIGTAGRRDDKDKMSAALYDAMLDGSRQVVKATGATGLVSGGAAWADHVAVSLAIEGAIDPKRLTLHLPAKLGATGFVEAPGGDRLDPGRVANYYHRLFAETTGRDPIAEIHEVVRRGAVVDEGTTGFKQRNSVVARNADGVLAFTFGTGPAWMPVVSTGRSSGDAGLKDGGTADTWEKSRAPVKIHVTLAPVADKGVDRTRERAAPPASLTSAAPVASTVPDRMAVVNVRDYPNNTLPSDVLYVGRGKGGVPGDFGNPFVVGRDGTAAETVEKFKPYFAERLKDPAFEARLMAATAGKTAVACFCARSSGSFACHGTVIADQVALRRARDRGADLSPAARTTVPAASSSRVGSPSQAAFDYALRESVAVDRSEQRLRAAEAAAAAPKPPQDRDVVGFGGPNRIFSNMAGAKVVWGDALTPEREWPNVEIPYHLARTNDVAVRDRLVKAADAGFRAAADRGESDTLAAEVAGKFVKKAWKEVGPGEADVERKEQIMRALVYDKYGRDQGASNALASTGRGRIVEQNAWGDVYWGVAERDIPSRGIKAGDGQNKLGEITQDARAIHAEAGPSGLLERAAAIRAAIHVPMGMDPRATPSQVPSESAVAAPVGAGAAPVPESERSRVVQAGPGSVVSGSGDMFSSGAEAIVNTVNCVGAMGAGIALRVKKLYPDVYAAYRRDVGIGLACDGGPDPRMGPQKHDMAAACCEPGQSCGSHKVRPGEVIVRPTGATGEGQPKYVIDFPSKRHWNGDSRLSDVEAGLPSLVEAIRSHGIKSVAVPPIGCGNGGLDWQVVGPKVRSALGGLSGVDVMIFDGIGAEIPPIRRGLAAGSAPAPVVAADAVAIEAGLRAGKAPTAKDPDAFLIVVSAKQASGQTGDAIGRVASLAVPVRDKSLDRSLAGGYFAMTVGYRDLARAASGLGVDAASQVVADMSQASLSSAENARRSSAAFNAGRSREGGR